MNRIVEQRVAALLEIKRDFSNKEVSEAQKTELRKVYRIVFSKQLPLACDTCIIEAIFELQQWYDKNVTNKSLYMSNNAPSKFQLKDGKLIQFGGTHYNKNTITDDVCVKVINSISETAAEKWLANNFKDYPKEWKSLRVNQNKLKEGLKKLTGDKKKAADKNPAAPAPAASTDANNGDGEKKNEGIDFSKKSLEDLQKLAAAYPEAEWKSFEKSKKKLAEFLTEKSKPVAPAASSDGDGENK